MSERVHDPVRRQRYAFGREEDDLIVDVWIEPDGETPLHFHPYQEERWTVIEGEVRFRMGRERRMLGPQDGEVVVGPGVKHALKNTGDREAWARAKVCPAGELQAFLEDFAAASRAGLYTRRGIPKSPRGAVEVAKLLRRHRSSTIVCGPPRAVQVGLRSS